MKKLLLLIICAIVFSGCSKTTKNDADALVITSDSSVGIRAFQGQPASEGKIVLQNTGKTSLKNIQVKLLTPNNDLTLLNHDCKILAPGESCRYLVQYLPHFASDDKDAVRNQFVTFIAMTDGKAMDDYTINLQSVANESWFYKGDFYFRPKGDTAFVKTNKGNMEMLYTFTNPDGDNVSTKGVYPIRSTDAIHWSVVGSFNQDDFLPTGDGVAINKNGIFMSVLTHDNQIAIAQYDNGNWRLLKRWDKTIMSDDVRNNLKEPDTQNVNLLADENGDLYVGLLKNINLPPVLKYDGKQWVLLSKDWPHSPDEEENFKNAADAKSRGFSGIWGSLNRLRKFGDTLYAATPFGVAKFEGEKWILLGTDLAQNQATNDDHKISSVGDVLQLPNGNLYATGNLDTGPGMVKYNPTSNNWSIVYKAEGWHGDLRGDMLLFNQKLYTCLGGVLQFDPATGDKKGIASCGGYNSSGFAIFFFKGELYIDQADGEGGGDEDGIYKFDPHHPANNYIEWLDLSPKQIENLSAETFCTIHKSNPLYEVSNHHIIKKEANNTTVLTGDNFGSPAAPLKLANDFFANATELYVAWGDQNPMKDSRYTYYMDCGSMSSSRINYVPDEKLSAPNNNQSSSKDHSPAGGISKYNLDHWEPIGEESWNQQELKSATGVQVMNNVLYAASVMGVVWYDGKNWIPVGKNTFPEGDFNIMQMDGKLYSAWDNSYETNQGDVFYYQYYQAPSH